MSKKVGVESVNLKNSCENTFVFKSQKVAATGYYDIEDSLPDCFFLELLSAACWLSRATGSQNGLILI